MKPSKSTYKPRTLEEYYEMLERMLKKQKQTPKKF